MIVTVNFLSRWWLSIRFPFNLNDLHVLVQRSQIPGDVNAAILISKEEKQQSFSNRYPLQMVVQGRWHHDSSLLQLPSVTPSVVRALNEGSSPISSLPELMHAVTVQRDLASSILLKSGIERFVSFLYHYTRIIICLTIVLTFSSNNLIMSTGRSKNSSI